MTRMNPIKRLFAVGIALGVGALFSGALAQDQCTELYDGETLRITTSNGPGGGFDFYMRTVGKYLEELYGVRVAARNVEGAGGTLGDNQLYFAEPDGYTIGLINFPGHVFAQLQGHPGVQYDFRDWQWVGRVAGIPPAIGVAPDAPYQSVDELLNTDEPVRFGLEGRGSDAYYGTVFLENVLGLGVNQVVGYGGPGEIAGAMLAGEIDARFESVDTLLPLVDQGELRLMLIFATEHDPRVPDVAVPADLEVSEMVRSQLAAFGEIYAHERSFVAPPETPEENVDCLREMLWEVWNNEDFLAEMDAAGRGVQPMRGAEQEAAVARLAAQADDIGPLLEEQ